MPSYFAIMSANAHLNLNSDENEISLYIITACFNIQVMRIKATITKDEMS